MSATRTNRLIGALLLVQLAGLIVPFVLLMPLGRDFLTTAAPAAGPIRAAVIALFATAGLTIGLSFLVARVGGRGPDHGSHWLVAAGVIVGVLQAVDNACILSMLTISERFARAATSDEALRGAADVLRTIRQWTHTMAILAIDVWIASLYVRLHRGRAVPRPLTVFGLATTALHGAAIPLRTMLGYGALGTLGMPMGVAHVALAGWLAVTGAEAPPATTPGPESTGCRP